MVRIALVGQPNCGKSTLFNHLVGYKANTSNLPGTTVEYLKSETLINGKRAEVIDLPGTYSLSPVDRAEAETRNFLRSGKVDAVLNVVDASLLSRSLELTLQLLEMGIPIVVCLNMLDEARRKGIEIDPDALWRSGRPHDRGARDRSEGSSGASDQGSDSGRSTSPADLQR